MKEFVLEKFVHAGLNKSDVRVKWLAKVGQLIVEQKSIR